MAIKWKTSGASRIFKQCLDRGYHPVVVRAGFNYVVIFCKETGQVWSISGYVQETTVEEWLRNGGKPFNDV